jgi:hypothetical protein
MRPGELRRKYAITILNAIDMNMSLHNPKTVRQQKYNEDVKQALIMVWLVANQICGKRLTPFLPELVSILESRGHLSLPADVRKRLLGISAATVDRLLKTKQSRHSYHQSWGVA